AVSDPSRPPLQLTSVFVSVSVTAGGWPTVMERVISQLLASTIRTECEVAVRPPNVCGDVPAVTSAAPSRLTRYGAVPPPKVAVTLPSLPPLQLTSTLVSVSVNAGGWLMVMDCVAEQLIASVTTTVCEPDASPLINCGAVA